MTRGIRFGAVTGWFTALAKACYQGPGPEIVHLGEGNLQPRSFALEIVERLRHAAFSFLTVYTAVRIITPFLDAVKILILASCTQTHRWA
jgi:hypothetical protein